MGRQKSFLALGSAMAAKTGNSATALAPGFRFHPTDEELVSYYLKRKVWNMPLKLNAIAGVDIYKHEPWELSDQSRLRTRDQEWYFFSLLDKKYRNGKRMNRATNQGYWKATGKNREVHHNSELVGMKKTLVFYCGRSPDELRTNWVMHEYRLVEQEVDRIGASQGYVLCRVFRKNNMQPLQGNQYVPFIEAEWDDGSPALIPSIDSEDDTISADDATASNDVAAAENAMNERDVKRTSFGQVLFKWQQNDFVDTPLNDEVLQHERTDDCPRLCQSKIERSDDCPLLCLLNKEAPLPLIQYKRRRRNDSGPNHVNVSDTSKIERSDDCPLLCLVNKEAPLPLIQYKRRRRNDSGPNHVNVSENSTRTTQATTSPSCAITTTISALMKFSSMESTERKENLHLPPPIYITSNLDSLVPPGCMKVIKELQNKIHSISVERDTLKLKKMSAQAMINILQSRIESLSKENEDRA